MRIPIFVAIGVMAWGSSVRAQGANPSSVLPERPSVATHAHTIAPGVLEIEFGAERTRAQGRYASTEVPLTLKLGLQRHTQLTVSTTLSRFAPTSVNDLTVGVKWRLAEHVPLVDSVAIVPAISVSPSSLGSVGVSLLLVASQSFGLVSVDLNAGYSRDAEDPENESLWAVALGGPLRGRVGWIAEMSGSPSRSGLDGHGTIVNSIVGATASLSTSLVVDAAFSVPVVGGEPTRVMFGAAWNVGQVWARTRRVP